MANFIEMVHFDCGVKDEPKNWWWQKVGDPNVCPHCCQLVTIGINGSQKSFELDKESLGAIKPTYPASLNSLLP